MNILLIDDDPVEHKLFDTYLLRAFGAAYELRHAETLQQGVDELSQGDVDAVFIDNRLHPFESYRETLPQLMEATTLSKVYLISACTTGLQNVCREFSIAAVLDKFDVRQAIVDGLLDDCARQSA